LNKEKELQILHYIYSSERFEALSSEEPDFIVTDLTTKQVFGVEITEFFLDECYARLKNIPHYIEEIITDKRYRNKGDKSKLPVHEVTVDPDTQASRNSNMIITDSPSKDELGRKIGALITNKDSKIVNYQKQATSLFLIIYDNQSCLNDSNPLKIHVSIYGLDLIKALLDSKFEEIFFITQSTDGKVYFRLKEINIMALVFLTFAFAQGYKSIAKEELFYIFLNLLSNIGVAFKISFQHDDYIQVVVNDMEFRLTDKKDILEISEINTNFCDTSFYSEDFCPDKEYFDVMKDDYLKFLRSNGLQTNFHHEKVDS
jgi:hypothetical protein